MVTLPPRIWVTSPAAARIFLPLTKGGSGEREPQNEVDFPSVLGIYDKAPKGLVEIVNRYEKQAEEKKSFLL